MIKLVSTVRKTSSEGALADPGFKVRGSVKNRRRGGWGGVRGPLKPPWSLVI